jgi:hypothetical protein
MQASGGKNSPPPGTEPGKKYPPSIALASDIPGNL